MGYGVLQETIRSYERLYPNIHFLHAVPPENVLEYTMGADVGLSLIENVCMSYYFCLPNKMFEYFSSGIPCIVSNFPDMKSVVEQYRCGWAIDVNELAIDHLIHRLTRDEIDTFRHNVRLARKHFSWKAEEAKLIGVYNSLLIGKDGEL